MCGICGYIGSDSHDVLPAMCDIMAHRGPDDAGVWHDAKHQVGLGQRRLSIIDTSQAGHQPMSNEDETIWVTFNGEIYDFDIHRRNLIEKGHIFRSRTDTEVLIHLYEEKGLEFLDELNGMFAFAIWDSRQQQLLLARDHAGIKPLYYRRNGSGLFFASEIKALLRIPGIRRELNYECIPDLLTFLWVPGKETLLKGIKKLEPGNYILWKNGNIQIRKWFTLTYEPDESVSENEWIERINDTLTQATCRQMVSDVPLGVLLSGGLDSSSLAALMRQRNSGREMTGYTAAIDDKDNTRDRWVGDYGYAKLVAQKLDVNLKSFFLKPDIKSLLPKMIYHLDEPDADPAVFPSYLIAKAARDDGTKVLLSGTGADEMFFGYGGHIAYGLYSRLRWVPRCLSGFALAAVHAVASKISGAQSPLARRSKKILRGLLADGFERHMAVVDWAAPQDRLSIYTSDFRDRLDLPEKPPQCMLKYFESFDGTGELNRHSHVLIQSFLAAHNFLYTDKTSMAASVEVRVPFMDIQLMRLCAKIPERYKLKGNTTKYILKKAMEKYLPKNVVYRPKTGFGAPLRKWIADDMVPLVKQLLSSENLRRRGLFEPAAVHRMIEENQCNRTDHSYFIYALLTLELWMQTFIDQPGKQTTI